MRRGMIRKAWLALMNKDWSLILEVEKPEEAYIEPDLWVCLVLLTRSFLKVAVPLCDALIWLECSGISSSCKEKVIFARFTA